MHEKLDSRKKKICKSFSQNNISNSEIESSRPFIGSGKQASINSFKFFLTSMLSVVEKNLNLKENLGQMIEKCYWIMLSSPPVFCHHLVCNQQWLTWYPFFIAVIFNDLNLHDSLNIYKFLLYCSSISQDDRIQYNALFHISVNTSLIIDFKGVYGQLYKQIY